MNYNLNKKRIIKVIGINIVFLFLILLICFIFYNTTTIKKIKIIALFMRMGLPIAIVLIGILGVTLTVYLNLRILTYKKEDILTITSDSITYDSFISGKIEINKQDIEKIVVTFHNDDYLIRNKYLAITTKKAIANLKNNNTFLNTLRKTSDKYCLYVNVSELNQDPEKIAFEIENKLNMPIKKLKKDLYFGDCIFLGDKL